MIAMTFDGSSNNFVNRRMEQKVVYDFCKGRFGVEKRCLIFRSKRDVGTTFFLEHLKQRLEGDWFTVYSDCKSSDPESIFNKFFAEVEQRPLLRWSTFSPLKETGKLFIQIVSAFISYIPGWGRPAAAVAGGPISNMAFTPYPSVSSERFAELITSGRWNRKIVFLVDNAQEIKPQSLNLLKTVFSENYDHVRFVLCLVEDEEDRKVKVEEFESRLTSLGLGVQFADFPPPDEQFLGELITHKGLKLPSEEQQQLLKQSNFRISYMVAALMGCLHDHKVQLTPTESEILRYLLVAEQPLAEDDINALMIRSQRINFTQVETQKSMRNLVTRGWIKHWKRHFGAEVEIAAGKTRHVQDIVSNIAFDLVVAQELYRYFLDVQKNQGTRHAPTVYGALLYKLAKQIDPQSLPQRAIDLVRISLGQADLDAARYYLHEAVGKNTKQSISDLYTRLAFHVSVQEYEKASLIFNQLGIAYWSNIRLLRIIHAVVENRLRHHDEANQEIDVLLSESSTTPEEWSLLTSYKVAGLMHEGKLQEAKAQFECNHSRFKSAGNYGYALRNCATIFFWDTTKDVNRAKALLDEASDIFLRQNDRFGYLTTLNNRGALLECTTSKRLAAESALPIFQEAFDGLSIYGVQHLEEVGANLGICLLLTGKTELAANHFRKLVAVVPVDFPRMLMESALAFAEAILGNISAARERMKQAMVNAGSVALGEAIYRTSVNAAVIEACAGNTGSQFESYIKSAVGSNFWGSLDTLNQIKEDAAKNSISEKNLLNYFSSGFFQYWSQNPLSVLSPSALPEHTKGDNMF